MSVVALRKVPAEHGEHALALAAGALPAGQGVQSGVFGRRATVPGAHGEHIGDGKNSVPFCTVSEPLRNVPAGQAVRNGPGTLITVGGSGMKFGYCAPVWFAVQLLFKKALPPGPFVDPRHWMSFTLNG